MGIQDFRPVRNILLLNDPANSVVHVVYSTEALAACVLRHAGPDAS